MKGSSGGRGSPDAPLDPAPSEEPPRAAVAGLPEGWEGEILGPVLVILGPTAAGKSSLGMRLARELGGEIVNADALQVYRGLDLGTDKPTPEMQREIPHHLVDVLDPTEPYSAGEFARRARTAIREILARDRLPVVVGGSGLYLKALLEGLSPLPDRDPAIRRRLKRRVEEEGAEALHRELAEADAETAERVAPRDRQRIVRALEVHAVSGRPMSELLREKTPDFVPVEAVRLGLTLPRAILYDRVAERISHMVENGWVDEVSALLGRGIPPTAPAFQAIGYRDLVRYIEGRKELDEAIEDITRATRRYAKRQLTWFRRVPDVHWLPAVEIESRLPRLLHELHTGGALAR